MANTREIKKRIVSVTNTKKITKTMEMVSSAKSKKLTDRVNASKPYAEKLKDISSEIMEALSSLAGEMDSPFLRGGGASGKNIKKVGILLITANRGLCGGYNANTVKLAKHVVDSYKEKGVEVELHVSGKKGNALCKFHKMEVFRKYLDIDDKVDFERTTELAEYFMNEYEYGRIDRFEIVSTVYHNAAKQEPGVTVILPLGGDEAEAHDSVNEEGKTERKKVKEEQVNGAVVEFSRNVLFEPAPEIILRELIPNIIKNRVYLTILEAITSEQIQRRIAMKNATDSAGEMIKNLTSQYNRARQASITQEITEIVAGADAIQ